MKKLRLLGMSCLCVIPLFIATTSEAAPIVIDSMVITVDNQESSIGNTFQGTQSFSGTMTVPDNVTVDYFTVELIDIQSSNLSHHATVLEYIDTSRPSNNTHVESMTFFGDDLFGPISVGETLIADGTTYIRDNTNIVISTDGMYDIFSMFVNGPGLQSPWIALNNTSWNSAVDSPYIYFEFEVSAYGELSQVPIPPAIYLFGSGLLGFIGIARKKHAKR